MDRRAAWVLGIVFGGMFITLFGFLLVLYLAVKSERGGGHGGGGGGRRPKRIARSTRSRYSRYASLREQPLM